MPRLSRATLSLLLLLGIVACAAYLRVYNLGSSPAWFRDEGAYAAVALSDAFPPRLGPLGVTFAGPYMTQPPLYFLLVKPLAGAFFGEEAASRPYRSLRFVNVIFGLAALVLTYGLARAVSSRSVSLLAVAVFACHPDIILYHRMILPYNLLQVWVVGAAWSLLSSFTRPRHLLFACLFSALASVTVYYGAVAPVIVVAVAFLARLPGRRMSLLALIPLPVMLLFLAFMGGGAFFDDFRALWRDAAPGSFYTTFIRYWDACRVSLLVPAGVAGLFLISHRGRRLVLLAFVFALGHAFLRRESTYTSHVPYPLCPLYPFLAVGAAQLLAVSFHSFTAGARRIGLEACPSSWPRERVGALITGLCAIALAAGLSCYFTWQIRMSVSFAKVNFDTPLRHSMVANVHHTRSVAAYLGARVSSGDLVIADQVFWPLLPCRVTNAPQVAAYRGVMAASDFYRYGFSTERFAYSPTPDGARYLVEDERLRLRLREFPDGAEGAVLVECRGKGWRQALRLGEYVVWENPEPPTR